LISDSASPSFVRDATLATSELVTNAFMHTPGDLELRAQFDGTRGWLRVEVSDSSTEPPRPGPTPEPGQVGGLGLLIVAALTSTWGTTPNERGKTVWFELVDR
jgi:anti-sigma regulatory factor (Ser/Thr protein kinase)